MDTSTWAVKLDSRARDRQALIAGANNLLFIGVHTGYNDVPNTIRRDGFDELWGFQVLPSQKPFNTAVLYVAALHLADNKGYLTLASDKEIASLPSSTNATDKAKIPERFCSQDIEYYGSKPRLLIAASSAIKTGVSLPPCDAMVLVDQGWRPEDGIQLSRQVWRSRATQKSPHMDFMLVIHDPDVMTVGGAMARKDMNIGALQRLLEKAFAKVALKRSAAADKDGVFGSAFGRFHGRYRRAE